MRILIVGGGIAGLTLAVALHRRGLTADLVERSPTWPTHGAAITMHANGTRMLHELGFGDAVDRASAVLPRWSFHDDRGDLLCETDLDRLWDGVGRCRGITRPHLHRILTSGGPVPHRLGVAVTALDQRAGHVTAGFSDGSHGDYDLVVGADGIRSTVRRLVIDARPLVEHGLVGWRGVAPIRPAGVGHLVVFLGDGCFFGLVPVGDGSTYGFAGLRNGPVEQVFAGFPAPVAEFLRAVATVHSGPIRSVDPPAWHRGRVLLIGDAAHATPPHAGQGGSMALEDAVVLAEILATTRDVPAALLAYTERRRDRVEWVRSQSRAAGDAWARPPAARNAALRERGDAILRERYLPLRARP